MEEYNIPLSRIPRAVAHAGGIKLMTSVRMGHGKGEVLRRLVSISGGQFTNGVDGGE